MIRKFIISLFAVLMLFVSAQPLAVSAKENRNEAICEKVNAEGSVVNNSYDPWTCRPMVVLTNYGGNVNIRRSYSTSSGVVASAASGTVFTIDLLSKSPGSNLYWYKIADGRYKGYWICASYLYEVTSYDRWMTVSTNSSNLNMRREPVIRSNNIICSIPKGRSVHVYYSYGNWKYIYYNGRYGWVSASYLR